MACGATKNGITCTLPSAGHPMPHKGMKNFWGFNVPTYWSDTDLSTAAIKRPLLGVSARLEWPAEALIDPTGSVVEEPPPPTLTPVGMDKSGSDSQSSSWTKVTGWVPRSGFPDTVVDADSIVMDQPGTVNVKALFNASYGGGAGGEMRIVKTGGTVLLNQPTENAQATASSVTVALDDHIWMEARWSGGFFGQSMSVTSGYVYTEVV